MVRLRSFAEAILFSNEIMFSTIKSTDQNIVIMLATGAIMRSKEFLTSVLTKLLVSSTWLVNIT